MAHGLWATVTGWRALLGRRVLVCPLARGMGGTRLLALLVLETAAREASLSALAPRLRQTDEAWIGHRLASRVGHIGGNAHLDPHCQAGGDMLAASLHLEDELGRGAIRSAQQPHPLDLLAGKRGQLP